MKNELKIFTNEEFGKVRIVEIKGKPYFIANDVAQVLGYASPKDAITRHCKGATFHSYLTEGGKQKAKVIPEGDIYRLIVKSKLPSAEKFERWVFDEVLPSIRKHGAYMTEDTLEQAISNPDFAIGLLTQLKDYQEQIKEKNRLIETQQPKVELYNDFLSEDGLYSIDTVSKVLAIKNLGKNNFYKYLRENKLLMTDVYRDSNNIARAGANHYQAYAQYTNSRGYFKHRTRRIGKNGISFIQNVAMFTTRGVDYIYKKLKRDGYVITKCLKEVTDELMTQSDDKYDIA